MPVSVVLCPTDQVENYWPKVQLLLQPAVDRSGGRASADQTYRLAMNGKVQIWLMYDENTKEIVAAGASELRTYPGRKILNVLLVAGHRMSEWLDKFIDKLKRFAIHNEAKALELYGRTGWIRKLESKGFKTQKACLMEMGL